MNGAANVATFDAQKISLVIFFALLSGLSFLFFVFFFAISDIAKLLIVCRRSFRRDFNPLGKKSSIFDHQSPDKPSGGPDYKLVITVIIFIIFTCANTKKS